MVRPKGSTSLWVKIKYCRGYAVGFGCDGKMNRDCCFSGSAFAAYYR
jgi:hypothetical protein